MIHDALSGASNGNVTHRLALLFIDSMAKDVLQRIR